MVKRLEEVFTLSEADRDSLCQATAAMLYTQGQTNLLPSSLTIQ